MIAGRDGDLRGPDSQARCKEADQFLIGLAFYRRGP